jgi:hypothetical protein
LVNKELRFGQNKHGIFMTKVINRVDVCQQASSFQKVDLVYKKLLAPNMLQKEMWHLHLPASNYLWN